MSTDIRPSQRSSRSIPTSSSGVIQPLSSAASPLAPCDLPGGSNSIRSNANGGNSVNVTVNSSTAPVTPESSTSTQSSSNKATLETMAQNIAANTLTLQGILTEMKLITDAITEQTRRSFAIEHSSYKVRKHTHALPHVHTQYTSEYLSCIYF